MKVFWFHIFRAVPRGAAPRSCARGPAPAAPVAGRTRPRARPRRPARPAPAAAAPEPTKVDPAAYGAQLVKDNGCLACHATDDKRLVGPGWGGLYNSKVSLADGSTVSADDAYLRESILHPNAKIVAGYPASVMPAYGTLLKEDDVNAIVAYLHTLEKQ